MKSRKLTPLYLLLLLCLPVLLNSCRKVEDGLSAITWQIDFDLVTTTWDIQFIDAASGLPITAEDPDEQVGVTITGADQKNILDLAGKRQPVFYSTKGAIALALHPDRAAPQEMTPVSFVIHTSHPSYIPANVPIITYQEGIIPLKIYLVSRTNAPENVDLLTQPVTGQLVDGKLRDTITLVTKNNHAAFRMISGTGFLTAGNVLLNGNLNFTISHWEGATVNGSRTLPGGQISVNSEGKPGLIYPACGIYIDLQDESGQYAAKISKPIECTALISPSVYDPVTNTVVTAGQQVPVWFMNPESAVWENKGTSLLVDSDNKLQASFSLASPGMYLIGWINENLCPSPQVLHPDLPGNFREIPYTFTLNIFERYGNELNYRFLRSAEIGGPAASDYNLHFLPANSELVFRFEAYTGEDNLYYQVPGPVLLSGYCESGKTADFDLIATPGSTYKKIEVVFIDKEHNNTRYNPKLFPGYYRKTGTTTWQSAFVYQGKAFIVNPQMGALYQMGVNYKGKFHMKEVTIGAEDVLLVDIEVE